MRVDSLKCTDFNFYRKVLETALLYSYFQTKLLQTNENLIISYYTVGWTVILFALTYTNILSRHVVCKYVCFGPELVFGTWKEKGKKNMDAHRLKIKVCNVFQKLWGVFNLPDPSTMQDMAFKFSRLVMQGETINITSI